jgi:hypothetical protein
VQLYTSISNSESTSYVPFAQDQESLDNINLFSIITVMSFFLLAPVTFFTEGVKMTPSFLQSAVSVTMFTLNPLLAKRKRLIKDFTLQNHEGKF